MSNGNELIEQLAKLARDVSKPVDERKAALKHIARLRGESIPNLDETPVEDLPGIVAQITIWLKLTGYGPTVQHAAEAEAESRLRREHESTQRR